MSRMNKYRGRDKMKFEEYVEKDKTKKKYEKNLKDNKKEQFKNLKKEADIQKKELKEAKGTYYVCDKCSKKFDKKPKQCPECGSKDIETVMDIFYKSR